MIKCESLSEIGDKLKVAKLSGDGELWLHGVEPSGHEWTLLGSPSHVRKNMKLGYKQKDSGVISVGTTKPSVFVQVLGNDDHLCGSSSDG